MKTFKDKLLNNSGVTLLELVVSVALFSLTMIIAANLFQSVLSSQREAIISQEMQENMRYSFERMGKEMRTAQKDKTHACLPSGNIYWTNGTQLKFKNYHNQCVCYFLSAGRLNVGDSNCSNSLPLTPQKIVISNLSFKVTDSSSLVQASVTMKMHVNVTEQGKVNENLDLQSSLSSRFYE